MTISLMNTLQPMVCNISAFCRTVLRGFKGDWYVLITPLLLGQFGFTFKARHVHGELRPVVKTSISHSADSPQTPFPNSSSLQLLSSWDLQSWFSCSAPAHVGKRSTTGWEKNAWLGPFQVLLEQGARRDSIALFGRGRKDIKAELHEATALGCAISVNFLGGFVWWLFFFFSDVVC